jgi:hypothetical protein
VAWGSITSVDVERVKINRAAISALTAPGGEVFGWCDNELGPVAVRSARASAPRRTGRLRDSIEHETRKVNQHACTMTLRAGGTPDAHYALYVHEGTTGPIIGTGLMFQYADSGYVGQRLVDAIAGGYPDFYLAAQSQVNGQAPQPFLRDGVGLALGVFGVW